MFRLEIPMLPGPELNPNARVHWSERHRAARDLRKAAWATGYNQNPEHDILFQRARVRVTLVYQCGQVMPDPDNAVAMLKPALDGAVDAKIIPDDDAKHVRYILPFQYQVDRERGPLTIMEFEADN